MYVLDWLETWNLRRNWRINLTTGRLNSTENFGYFCHIPSVCDKGIGELTKKHDHNWHCAASAHGRKNTQSKQNLILSTWKSKLKRDNDKMQWNFTKYSHSSCARIESVNDSIIDKFNSAEKLGSWDEFILFRCEKIVVVVGLAFQFLLRL